MKRAVFLLAILLLLTSCQEDSLSCYRIFKSLSFSLNEMEVYPYQSDTRDAKFFSRLYYGQDNEQLPDEFAYCDDYYVVLSSGSEICELHIFRVISTYHTASLESMLQKRRDRMQRSDSIGFYSEITRERIAESKVFSVDHYVILAITDQNDLIEREMKEIIL